jgi:hypothetical protein
MLGSRPGVATHDFIVAAHEIVGSSGILVAVSFVVAGYVGVGAFLSKTMHPAILHGAGGANRRTHRRPSRGR